MKMLSSNPHIIVFSNEHPDETKMTPDRYIIETFDNEPDQWSERAMNLGLHVEELEGSL